MSDRYLEGRMNGSYADFAFQKSEDTPVLGG